jgi:hypothetical protein
LATAGSALAAQLPTSVTDPPPRAPNGAPAGYVTAPSVVGAFPSTAMNGGPLQASSKLHLGALAGVDDGVAVNYLRPCATSEITVLINARAVAPANRKGSVYVNAWFDWGRNGSWSGSGCGVDRAIQNFKVGFARLGKRGVIAVPITFPAGSQVQELWFRVSVTRNEMATSYTGAPPTSYKDGESEDYLYRSINNGTVATTPAELTAPMHAGAKHASVSTAGAAPAAHAGQSGADFEVSCIPNPAILPHKNGSKVTVDFSVYDGNPTAGPIDGSKSRNNVYDSGWSGPALHPAPNQNGVPAGKIAVDSFTLTPTDKDPQDDFLDTHNVIEHKKVGFFFTRAGSGSQTLQCAFDIVHTAKPPPPKPAPKPKPPPKLPKLPLTFASDLAGQAQSLLGAFSADVSYWLRHVFGGASGASAHASQASNYVRSATVPVDGTITGFTLKGYAISGDMPGPGGSEPIRFSVARPQPNGQLQVITTTNPPYTLPGTPGTYTFSASTLSFKCCKVKAGDVISLDARGGEFAVFASVPGSETDSFSMAGLTQNPGYMWTPTPHQNVELLLQVAEQPG